MEKTAAVGGEQQPRRQTVGMTITRLGGEEGTPVTLEAMLVIGRAQFLPKTKQQKSI